MDGDAKKKYISMGVIIFICTIIILSGITAIKSGCELRKTRAELDSATRELHTATDNNRQLEGELGRQRALIENSRRSLDQLSATTESSAGTVSECIELIRKIKLQVKELEDCLYCRNTNRNSSDSNNDNINNEKVASH